MPGKGKLVLTGKLGEVMQESAQTAMSYVRSRPTPWAWSATFKIDLHVHFPEGAVPKDGPSAGITMVTSLVSALLRLPVRRDVADDRRNHPARSRPSHRRRQGQDPRRPPSRHFHLHHPERNQRIKEIPPKVLRSMTIIPPSTWTKCCEAPSSSPTPPSSFRNPRQTSTGAAHPTPKRPCNPSFQTQWADRELFSVRYAEGARGGEPDEQIESCCLFDTSRRAVAHRSVCHSASWERNHVPQRFRPVSSIASRSTQTRFHRAAVDRRNASSKNKLLRKSSSVSPSAANALPGRLLVNPDRSARDLVAV